jgi:hypothetical protein
MGDALTTSGRTKRGVLSLGLALAALGGSCTRSASPGGPSRPVVVARGDGGSAAPVVAGDPPAEPRARSILPTPPKQGAPFDPPPAAAVSPKLAAAVAELFALGVGDPRGLPYRAVEVPTGSVWSGAGEPAKTHAFLLPKTGEARFCVLWNGLVHPCKEIEGAAAPSIERDVKELAAHDADERAKYARENPTGTFHRWGSGDASGAVLDTPTWTKVAMLVRLGEPALAASVRAALRGADGGDNEELAFLVAAGDWLWARYERAITSHMAGDDALALASLDGLLDARAQADAVCVAAGLQPANGRGAAAGAVPTQFDFLAGAAALLADQQRRARAPAGPFDLAKVSALPQPARITALIARLDEVNERQWGQPGGVSLGSSNVVQALVKEGEAAVEPLIDAIEHDARLTRSVHFWRDFSRSRSVLGVHEAAYAAVSQILDVSVFAPAATGDDLSARGPEGRAAVARAIRAHVAKWKGVSLEERWYRVLADDQAPPADWAEAARAATQPTNVTIVPSSMVFTTTMTVATAANPGFRGEVLRAHAAPTLTALLEKRARAAADVSARCVLAHALVTWDPAASDAAGRDVFADGVRDELAGKGGRECLATLTLDRVAAHHGRALADYADWIERAAPASFGFGNGLDAFHPMALHANDPDVARAARRVFAKGSPWLAAVGDAKADFDKLTVVKLPLAITPLRQRVLEYLDDATVIGTSEVKAGGGSVSITFNSGASSGTSIPEDDKRVPKAGVKQALRVADFVAWELSTTDEDRKDVPRFGVHWPLAARDQALRALKAKIRALP